MNNIAAISTDSKICFCHVCGKEMVKMAVNQLYCSDECRKIKYKYVCKCVVCGDEFKSASNSSKYCTPCVHQILQNSKCEVCGKSFVATTLSSKYCGDECRKKAYKCNCKGCKKEFFSNTPGTNYCSNECRNKKVERECLQCKKPFFVEQYKNKKICSDICKKERARKKLKTKKPIGIKEHIENVVRTQVTSLIKELKSTGNSFAGRAIDYYKSTFSESLKTRVLERDSYSCQICDKDTGLHVHHKIKRKNGGAHEMGNLITLCASCHRAVETGNQAHAIRKCTRNAFKNRNISVTNLKAKLNRMEMLAEIRNDIENAFKHLIEGEVEEAMVLMDGIIEGL